jgi:CheY-like chemotaxis protein
MNPTTYGDMDLSAYASRTVMVVNGPGSILELFESVLEPGHYDVVVVESGDRAYSQIKMVQPDLVILCVRMDEPASLQVCRCSSWIRRQFASQSLPTPSSRTIPNGSTDWSTCQTVSSGPSQWNWPSR